MEDKKMLDNEVLRAIHERRAIRHFQKKQLSEEDLTTILEAGTWAPTGKGTQEPWIVAVQNEEMKAELIAMNAEVLGTKSNPYFDSPTIILVFAEESNYNNYRDGSLVLGTMMLAAHSLGVGTCWINREDAMFATPKGKLLMQKMGLPEGLIGIGALAIGYPEQGHKVVAKPRKADYYRIIK